MTRLTDGNKTVEIEMTIWTGSGYSPDWSGDFFEVGGLEYDDAKEAYKVEDVDYCVDQANDWKNSEGDFAGDEPNEDNTVFIEEV